ncbi:MAG: carboxypeptidase-like regulatory domain-containing protein [Verrucomicrobia bacterium]|nr:carboxypeptidase-like regulatory domain-containing protein [Verrucomicrobiota bacterium]
MDTLLNNIYEQITGIGSNSISGLVFDINKVLLKNTTVLLVSSNLEGGWGVETTTDSKGMFTAEQLPSDEYFVVVEGYGRSPNSVMVHGGLLFKDNEFCLEELPDQTVSDDYSKIRQLSLLNVEGIPHLFFVRRGLVFNMRYEEGAWTAPELLAAGTSPVPVYAATLFEDAPAIAVFHNRAGINASEDIDIPVDPNDVQIMVTLGLPDGEGGWIWHEAVEYAAHDVAAFGSFDAVLASNGEAVVMWTASDISMFDDDADLYTNYGALGSSFLGDPIETEAEESASPQAKYFDYNEFQLPGWDPFKTATIDECKAFNAAIKMGISFSKGSSKNQAKFLTKIFGTHSFSMTGILEGSANLKEAKASAGIDVAVSMFTDSLDALDRGKKPGSPPKINNSGKGVTISGKARVNAHFKMNRDFCLYEYNKMSASLGLAVQARVPIPNLSFTAGPLAEVYVGIQIDAILGGEFEWLTESIVPSVSSVSLGGGIGGYFVGEALGGALVLSGSLTGNMKAVIDAKGFRIDDIFFNGTFSATAGPWARSYGVKYSVFSGALTVSAGGTLDPASFGLPAAADEGYTRSYTNSDGLQIDETIYFSSKAGTAAVYSNSGMSGASGTSYSVLASVASDFEDDSKPTLFTTSEGDTLAVWIREQATAGTGLNNSIMYAEFNGSNWSTPVALSVTGANREVRVIEDINGKLLVVFAHADMTGFSTASDVQAALEAYEAADLCYIRKTDTGWSTPQLLNKIPGIANNLRLHSLVDGTVFATWLESDIESGKLYVQMWDSNNMLWLPFSKLSKAQANSNAALGQVGDNPMAIWSELINLGGNADLEDLVEQLTYSTLSNGSWSDPAALDVSFFTPEESGSVSPLFALPGSSTRGFQQQGGSFSEIFNINNLVKIPEGCCDVIKDIDDIPDIKDREFFVPDERRWPMAVGSFDPNDKFGLNGHGPEGWIGADQVIPYTILFENDPEEGATAPALRVTISDTLDPDYDYNTFSFREFGWADVSQEIPENTQNFVTDVDFKNADGTPLVVRVTGSFDRTTGAIGVVFDSLDPATGLNPFGAFDGFLQVEDDSGNGQGFIGYDVKQKVGLPQGTMFENTAEIVFDLNDPIETPTVLHTIDLDAPTSEASSPPTSNSSSFVVMLDGEDPGGSGVAYYTVYHSVDGGPFSVWLGSSDTPNPDYLGLAGHTYSFYSIATDWAGIKEVKEPLIETTTLVTASDFGIELIEMLDEDTVRFILKAPGSFGATIRVETADLIDPYQWFDVETITVTDLGDNRFEITAPYTEETRQFFRFVVGD